MPVAEVEFSWASSDTLVAAVDDAGLATAVGAGQAEVTATAAGITGRAELTVVAPAPTAVAVTPDTVALTALGQTAQLTAEVRDQAGRRDGGRAGVLVERRHDRRGSRLGRAGDGGRQWHDDDHRGWRAMHRAKRW